MYEVKTLDSEIRFPGFIFSYISSVTTLDKQFNPAVLSSHIYKMRGINIRELYRHVVGDQ